MSSLFRRGFLRSEADSLIHFSLANPLRPFHSRELMLRFITELSSNDELVIDLHDQNGRVAVAVVLDQITNPSNSACLEILGLRSDIKSSSKEIYSRILTEAKRVLPARQNGIEAGFFDSAPVSKEFYRDHGFHPYYTTYEMMKVDAPASAKVLPQGFCWSDFSLDRLREYHHVVKRAFEKNLESSVPGIEQMERNLPQRKIAPKMLLEGNQVIGFMTLEMTDDSTGEINTVGLLPEYRMRGLGGILLDAAVEELAKRGAKKFKLTVAAENETALHLYKKRGFEILNVDLCMRYAR